MGVKIDGKFTSGDPDDALPAPGDPMGAARVLIRDQQTAAGELTLRHWRGSWMEWQETHWIEAEDKASCTSDSKTPSTGTSSLRRRVATNSVS